MKTQERNERAKKLFVSEVNNRLQNLSLPCTHAHGSEAKTSNNFVGSLQHFRSRIITLERPHNPLPLLPLTADVEMWRRGRRVSVAVTTPFLLLLLFLLSIPSLLLHFLLRGAGGEEIDPSRQKMRRRSFVARA